MGILDSIKSSIGISDVADERFYEAVAAELAQGGMRPGLWTKALADSNLDEKRAKARYIRLRVAALKEEAARNGRQQAESRRALANQEKNLEDGAMDAYRRGEYENALKGFVSLAHKGDAWAQYNLGIMCSKGQGTPMNLDWAVDWLRKSANQNNKDAQYTMGCMNMNVPYNYALAVDWLKLAEKNGHHDALRMKKVAQKFLEAQQKQKAQSLLNLVNKN